MHCQWFPLQPIWSSLGKSYIVPIEILQEQTEMFECFLPSPHPRRAEKGVEVQQPLLFLCCYIIAPCLCGIPPAFSVIKPIPRLGKPKQGKGMWLAQGYAANQWWGWEEKVQVPTQLLLNPYKALHSCHSLHILLKTWNVAASQADHLTRCTTCFLMIASPARVHKHMLVLFLVFVSRWFRISGNRAHHARRIHWPVILLFGSLP